MRWMMVELTALVVVQGEEKLRGEAFEKGGRSKRGAVVLAYVLAVRLVLFIASYGYIPDHHMACHIRP